MEIKVKEEKDNPFFERKELLLELKHPNSKTPSKPELLKDLTSKYSAPEENILVDYIFTKKGITQSVAKVKIYKKKPKIKTVEKKEEKPKKEAKPKEAKPEPKKQEEKPEEQKAEKKEEKKVEKSEAQASEKK